MPIRAVSSAAAARVLSGAETKTSASAVSELVAEAAVRARRGPPAAPPRPSAATGAGSPRTRRAAARTRRAAPTAPHSSSSSGRACGLPPTSTCQPGSTREAAVDDQLGVGAVAWVGHAQWHASAVPSSFAYELGVDLLDPLDLRDVAPRLRELDPDALLAPAVDVARACVVGGERGALVAVAVEEVAEVPRAVADVDLGRRRGRRRRTASPPVRTAMPRAVSGSSCIRPDRAGVRARLGVEPALGVDHGREQRRVEVVVLRVAAHDRLVPQRVADPLDEVRLMARDRERGRAEHRDTRRGR